jgi:hypothetical protein
MTTTNTIIWKRPRGGRLIRLQAPLLLSEVTLVVPEVNLVVPIVALNALNDNFTGFIIQNNDCLDGILSFLIVAEMLKTLATSKVTKALIIPTALGAVNFHQFKRKPISYWKAICHHQTVLREISIEVGSQKCEIVESLLLRCQTNILQSFKMWIGGKKAWTRTEP